MSTNENRQKLTNEKMINTNENKAHLKSYPITNKNMPNLFPLCSNVLTFLAWLFKDSKPFTSVSPTLNGVSQKQPIKGMQQTGSSDLRQLDSAFSFNPIIN